MTKVMDKPPEPKVRAPVLDPTCERLQVKFLRSTYHNSVSESFFHTLKTELTYHQTYVSREDAKQSIFKFIEVFYNRERLHSANGYKSPVDFELQHKAA